MPAKKEHFDNQALLDEAEAPSPLPIAERVQPTPARPYLNTRYLAARVSGAELDRQTAHPFPTAFFQCPVCGGDACASWGTTPDGPFKISCSRSCSPAKLRKTLRDIAPAAFEARGDILYSFPSELEERVTRAVLDGDSTPSFDKDARRAVRRFRDMGGEVRSFPFRGPAGATLMIVFRRDRGSEKSFLPVHVTVDPSDRGDIEFTFPKGLLPLLGWSDLLARPDAPVLVVEGEQSAFAAEKLLPDHVVITSACGSGNASKSDWSSLHGRDVTIWPDNDTPGNKYARAVAAHAFGAGAKSVRIVRLPDKLPDGWDLADEFPDDLSLDQVRQRIAHAPEVAWEDVKDALIRANNIRRLPPFRLPDGMFATDKVMVKAIEKATSYLAQAASADPGWGCSAQSITLLGKSDSHLPTHGRPVCRQTRQILRRGGEANLRRFCGGATPPPITNPRAIQVSDEAEQDCCRRQWRLEA